MAVRKFRSVEDMPPVSPRPPLDPENLREVCGLMELTRRLSGLRLPAGVRKFRSLEEAHAYRDLRDRHVTREQVES